MIVIKFDKNVLAWSKNQELNYQYLLRQMEYLRAILAMQGYLYLNMIYESLGVAWNPDDDNICIRDAHGFIYGLVPTEDGYFIEIEHA